MIDVYMRECHDSEGQLLGQFPPDQIRYLPDLFKSHIIVVGTTAENALFYGTQFVVDTTGCYFEILIECQKE